MVSGVGGIGFFSENSVQGASEGKQNCFRRICGNVQKVPANLRDLAALRASTPLTCGAWLLVTTVLYLTQNSFAHNLWQKERNGTLTWLFLWNKSKSWWILPIQSPQNWSGISFCQNWPFQFGFMHNEQWQFVILQILYFSPLSVYCPTYPVLQCPCENIITRLNDNHPQQRFHCWMFVATIQGKHAFSFLIVPDPRMLFLRDHLPLKKYLHPLSTQEGEKLGYHSFPE